MRKESCSLLNGSTLNDKIDCQLESRYFLQIILFPLTFPFGEVMNRSRLGDACNIFSKRGEHQQQSEQVSAETNLKQVIILPNTKSAVVKTLIF